MPHGDAFAPIHIPELRDVLEPPLEAEYVEYVLGLPEHIFHTVTSMCVLCLLCCNKQLDDLPKLDSRL